MYNNIIPTSIAVILYIISFKLLSAISIKNCILNTDNKNITIYFIRISFSISIFTFPVNRIKQYKIEGDLALIVELSFLVRNIQFLEEFYSIVSYTNTG